MKKFTTEIIKKSVVTTIYVWVDERTARILKRVDEKTRHDYIVSEHEVYLNNLKETRRHVSYEECLEKGVSFSSRSVSFEDIAIDEELLQELKKAISDLPEKEQWLINEVFYNDRKKRDVAMELGVSESAVGTHIKRILKKIRKNFES